MKTIFDGHIHIAEPMQIETAKKSQNKLLDEMDKAGISGGIVLSPNPNIYGNNFSPKNIIDQAKALCAGQDHLYPFYWIDPVSEYAAEHVELAVDANIAGFKVICSNFYPGDERAMKTYNLISEHKKPILFHSGILWDGKPSSQYNRPGEFECLLEIPGLKFTLAHISWPWCDECIAVFGKFMNAYSHKPGLSTEMFIDITPGTPRLWRREVFGKLFLGDYDVTHNVIFGTDCNISGYNSKWAVEWIERDMQFFEECGLAVKEGFLDHIYHDNMLRLLGIKNEDFDRTIPEIAL